MYLSHCNSQGRLLSDNIVLGHELVKGYSMRGISPRCMLKIDLQKAYDSVERVYLEAGANSVSSTTPLSNISAHLPVQASFISLADVMVWAPTGCYPGSCYRNERNI
ncbi:hypothetical protein MTR67_002350 [Solanum verrucosum]|uniref:Reverse transcriptase domain-containing protein n=1 Tax=Solanum verrucosum TaxID=315347 RepID=A0AAF0TD82_SOLVR|nr:hypothetical protein MTR67_002350 [Solanum verrucosum]